MHDRKTGRIAVYVAGGSRPICEAMVSALPARDRLEFRALTPESLRELMQEIEDQLTSGGAAEA